jgi:hypothetical protein
MPHLTHIPLFVCVCVQKTYFMKMCKDCQLLTHLAQADIAIMYQSEVCHGSALL